MGNMSWTTTSTATDRWFLLSDNFVSVEGIVASGAVDSAHTGKTHILRPGLALTFNTASGQWFNTVSGDTYDGILLNEVDLKDGDTTNSSTAHPGAVVVIGAVASGQLLGIHASVAGPHARLLVHS